MTAPSTPAFPSIDDLANRVTYFQVQELLALQKTNDATKGPSFIFKHHWRGMYQSMTRLGLVDWGDPPNGFSRQRFSGASVTDLGRQVLARIEEIDNGEDYSDD